MPRDNPRRRASHGNTNPDKEKGELLVAFRLGKGLCSQAAERKETIIVQDVSKETNYLSCSVKVKSEAVIPIFKKGKLVGELDIDSHTLSPFTDEDMRFLEKVCEIVSVLFY